MVMQSKSDSGGKNHAATIQLDFTEHADLHMAAIGGSKSALLRACICPKLWRRHVQQPAEKRRRQIAASN